MSKRKRVDRFRKFKKSSQVASVLSGLASGLALLAKKPHLSRRLIQIAGGTGLLALTPSATLLKRVVSKKGRKFSKSERALLLNKAAEGIFNTTFLSHKIPVSASVVAGGVLVASGRRSDRLARRQRKPRTDSRR